MPKVNNVPQFYVHREKNFNEFLNKTSNFKYNILTNSLESISCLNIISWLFAKIFRRDELTEDSICESLEAKFDDVKQFTPLHLLDFEQRTTAMGNLISLKNEFKDSKCINKIENLIESLKFKNRINATNSQTSNTHTPIVTSLNQPSFLPKTNQKPITPPQPLPSRASNNAPLEKTSSSSSVQTQSSNKKVKQRKVANKKQETTTNDPTVAKPNEKFRWEIRGLTKVLVKNK